MFKSSTAYPIRLAIDTSTEACSVAIQTPNGQIVDASSHTQSTHHAQAILSLIEQILQKANLALTDIQDIAVSIGPGSFTGVRAGIATTQGLAYGLNIPVIPMGTLDLVALGTQPEGLVHVIMDARMQQFYVASFHWVDKRLVTTEAASLLSAPALLTYLSLTKEVSDVQLVGTGLSLIQDQLSWLDSKSFSLPQVSHYPQAKNLLAYLNQLPMEAINSVSPMELVPLYVRNEVAVVKEAVMPAFPLR